MAKVELTKEQEKEIRDSFRALKEKPRSPEAVPNFCKYWPAARSGLELLENMDPDLKAYLDPVIQGGNLLCGGSHS